MADKNILDQLKELDQSKLSNTTIAKIEKALKKYDIKDDLLEAEIQTYTNIYNQALKDIEKHNKDEEDRVTAAKELGLEATATWDEIKSKKKEVEDNDKKRKAEAKELGLKEDATWEDIQAKKKEKEGDDEKRIAEAKKLKLKEDATWEDIKAKKEELEKEAELTLEYEAYMQENELEFKGLPVEIRKKINAVHMQMGKYKNNPTENQKNAILSQSANILELVKEFKEGGSSSNDDDDDDHNIDPELAERAEAVDLDPETATLADIQEAEEALDRKKKYAISLGLEEDATDEEIQEAEEAQEGEKEKQEKEDEDGIFGNPMLKAITGV